MTPATDPDAVLAAGLLSTEHFPTAHHVSSTGLPSATSDSSASDSAAPDHLLDALRHLSSASLLWSRLGRGAPLPDRRGWGGPHLPRWTPPGLLSDDDAARAAAAWRALVAEHPIGPEYVRVEVDSPEEAEELRSLTGVTGGPVSATISMRELDFEWRWPLRIGVIGPRARQWVHQVNDHPHCPGQFEARAVGLSEGAGDSTGSTGGGPEPLEVLVVDGDALTQPDQFDEAMRHAHAAACVLVVGTAPARDLLEPLRGFPRILVAAQQPDVAWWGALYDELAHDRPLDVAVTLFLPGALVAGMGRVLDLTAAGHWALELARREPALAELEGLVGAVGFDSESQGTAAILDQLSRRGAVGAAVRESHGQTAAIGPDDRTDSGTEPPPDTGATPPDTGATPPETTPPDTGATPPDTTPPDTSRAARRLIGDVWAGGTRCRSAIPPDTDSRLDLRIDVPTPTDVAAGEDFPEQPAPGLTTTYEVEVASPLWPAPRTGQVIVPNAGTGRSQAASFTFHSGPDGTNLMFEVVVRHAGRALQTAVLTAPVRAQTVPNDEVRFIATATTAGPEPAAAMTAAAYSLTALGAEIRRGATAVALHDARDLVDALEQEASRTLGVHPAPETLTDPKALALLRFLAQRGAELRERLAPLGVGATGDISLLVRPTSPIWPLELVYQADAPRSSAELCRHAHAGEAAPPWGTPCDKASESVVCPYAFWGMYRTIVREVELAPGDVHPTTRLTLRPVLYAATAIADRGTPRNAPRPSDQLEADAEAVLGDVTRVTSWRAWRKAVTTGPELLLLLAHRDTFGHQARLHIGRESVLESADVRRDVIAGDGAVNPLVLLIACASAAAGTAFGTLPGAFAARGASAVVGTLSQISGPQGARAGRAVLRALHDAAASPGGTTLGEALARARRDLVAEGLVLGLLLVSHGDIDLRLEA